MDRVGNITHRRVGQVTRMKIVASALVSHMTPDNKVHGANMGPSWGRQDPGGPHVGPMNFAI